MRFIIADVSKHSAAKRRNGSEPIVKENGMSEFPERYGEDDEKGRRHDKAVFVHGEVMMNTV